MKISKVIPIIIIAVVITFSLISNNTPARVIEINNLSGNSDGEYENIYNLTYDPLEIQKEVIEEIKLYFDSINFKGVNFEECNDTWRESFYTNRNKAIYVCIKGIEDKPEWYRHILAHEYIHYLIYTINGTGDDETHEAIADAYARFTNLEASKEIWGEENQDRFGEYAIISNKLIAENNWGCLNKVFDKEDKISTLEEINKRLNKYCGLNDEYLIINNSMFTEGQINWTLS